MGNLMEYIVQRDWVIQKLYNYVMHDCLSNNPDIEGVVLRLVQTF